MQNPEKYKLLEDYAKIFSHFEQLYCEIWGSRMCNHAQMSLESKSASITKDGSLQHPVQSVRRKINAMLSADHCKQQCISHSPTIPVLLESAVDDAAVVSDPSLSGVPEVPVPTEYTR